MPENLMVTVLTVTFSTSCVIILLFGFTAPLRKRYGARWLYLAWLVVALRLLIPINLSIPVVQVRIPVPEQMTHWGLGDTIALSEPEDFPSVSNEPREQNPSRPPFPIGRMLTVVWAVGAAGFLVTQAIIYRWFRRQLRCRRTEPAPAHIRAMLERVGAQMELSVLPDIGINTGVPAPLLIGLLRPTLLLPHAGYKDGELALILRHELVHYRRHDLWYKLLLLTANAVHWFNPFAYLMVCEAGNNVEMSCDDCVMAELEPALRADYCDTILNTLPVKGSAVGAAMTTSFGSTKGNTKMRIQNVFDPSKKRRGMASLCGIVALTVVIGGMAAHTTVSAASNQLASLPENSQQMQTPTDPRLKLVERVFTMAELKRQNISGVKVLALSEQVSVTRGGDKLRFSYYQLSDDEYNLTTVPDGGGTRTYWALLREAEGSANDPQRTIHITLPEDYTFLTLYARTSSGDISFKDCVSYDYGIHAYAQSGNIVLDNCTAYGWVNVLSNTGNIHVKNLLESTFTKICADTGNVVFQPSDRIGNYHFEFDTKPTNTITIDGKSYSGGVFELNQNASRTVEMVSGSIELSNKEEIDGAGTASFTITHEPQREDME